MVDALRAVVTVQKPTPSGLNDYSHIVHVVERTLLNDTPEERRKVIAVLRRRVKDVEKGDPTRKVSIEEVEESRW